MKNFIKEVCKRKEKEQNIIIKNAYEERIKKVNKNIDILKYKIN